jgi:hypothetical protein
MTLTPLDIIKVLDVKQAFILEKDMPMLSIQEDQRGQHGHDAMHPSNM